MIVNAFKNKMFPTVPDDFPPYDGDIPSRSRSSSTIDRYDFTADYLDRIYIGNDDDLDELPFDIEKYLDPDLIEKNFFNKSLRKIFEFLKHEKGTRYNKNKVTLMKSRFRDLKNDIKNMPENEVKNKILDLLANLVEKILDINEQLDIADLESEESTAQRREHEGQGLKMLTPQQILSRLPISLAQLKAGNNSQKLKNEIRQLLHSLYR